MSTRIQVSEIFGYPVCIGKPKELLEMLVKQLTERNQTHVVTLNAEMIMTNRRKPETEHVLKQADVYISDGVGLTWAARMLKKGFIQRYPGIDLVFDLMTEIGKQNGRVFLLGAGPGIAERAGQELKKKINGLNIVGVNDGYFSEDEEKAVIEKIKATKPDLLLVGMGSPRQEQLIAEHREQLDVPIMVGVGGALEVFAGYRRRAPRWMRGTGLEWAFRCTQDLSRIRRIGHLVTFIFMVISMAIRRAE